ncbi:hypothetical protein PV11_06022 [Exophiala sideris]|uniref:Glycosylphosphatidylinositol anchor biosynthesis protein 11 n=1 Tax=Exophiala sideris TaxID=1016849 RepID=A0A0D1YMF8_9EURO|nr:hypothetical protein PV11_06022 [Exophiala sideris]
MSSSRLLTPTTLPIPLLSFPLSKRYSYAHTLLIPAYYYLRASALVADPFPTMLTDLLVIGFLQAVFCTVCLPSAGYWVSGTAGGKIVEGTASTMKSSKGGTRSVSSAAGAGGGLRKKGGVSNKHDGVGGSFGARVMPTFFSLVLTLFLPPLPLAVMALVLGAPLYPTSLLPTTLALAVHVSLLGFLPIFYTHGVSSPAWRDVAAAWLPFDEAGVWAGTVGGMVGGWIGAVPMALDWDREWQKWPCTVLWGVVVGWAVGRVLTNVLRLGIGKRINLSEHEEREDNAAAGATAATADKMVQDGKID